MNLTLPKCPSVAIISCLIGQSINLATITSFTTECSANRMRCPLVTAPWHVGRVAGGQAKSGNVDSNWKGDTILCIYRPMRETINSLCSNQMQNKIDICLIYDCLCASNFCFDIYMHLHLIAESAIQLRPYVHEYNMYNIMHTHCNRQTRGRNLADGPRKLIDDYI